MSTTTMNVKTNIFDAKIDTTFEKSQFPHGTDHIRLSDNGNKLGEWIKEARRISETIPLTSDSNEIRRELRDSDAE